jgi:branched-chain amino acid transport system permease protein
MERVSNLAAPFAVLACAVAIASALPNYLTFVAISGVIVALVAASVGLLAGQVGLASLCQMSFCGVGAWCACWLNVHAPEVTIWGILVLSPIAAAAVGALIGLPALRLRGINLAALTLAFAIACDAAFVKAGFPGNETNIGFERPALLSDDHALLIFSILCFAGVSLGLELIRKAKLGAAWAAIAHSERAAAALGISVWRSKILAFGISAAIAGFAGVLMTLQLGTLTGRNFEALTSLAVFSLGVFTAAHLVEGAIVAGVLTIALPEVLRRVGLPLDFADMLFGIGAVQALYQGGGIGTGIRKKFDDLRGPKSTQSGAIASPAATIPDHFLEPEVSLRINDLSVSYGHVVAVDEVGFDIPPRAIVALIGPNGAGKSTIIDALSGFIPHYQGVVALGRESLAKLPPDARARLGIRRTFQQCRAIPDLTALQYLRLSAGSGVTEREAAEILTFLQCCSPQDLIRNVEIGLRRLIEIAAALAAKPRVLLLDEPAAGLSSEQSRALAQRIAEIPDRFGCSILLVEHDMPLVQAVCSNVVILDFGKVIASGPPEQALKRPEVIAAYLGKEVA